MSPLDPDDTFGRALLDYCGWLRAGGKAMGTVVTRATHLRAFVNWSAREGWHRLQEVTLDVLERYRGAVIVAQGRGGAPLAWSTRLGRVTAVRLWLRWAVRTRLLPEDPTTEWTLPRVPRRLPRSVLGAEEVEAVLRRVDHGTVMGLRDRALIEVMYSTGMRRGEIVRLSLSDVDSARGLVFVREGKGGKDRVVPIGKRALEWFARYLRDARPHLASRRRSGQDPGSAFLGARGERVRPSRLTERLHGYVQRGSGKPGSCHVFRHSMATLMHDGGADIRDLQELLGHAQLSTTEIYTHVSVERLRTVHALTHPAEAGPAWLGRHPGGGIGLHLSLPPQSRRSSGRWGARGTGG